VRALFVDLASHDGLLAAVNDDRVEASVHIDHRIADDALFPAVEKTLSDAGWSFTTLRYIACVTGPGGFTSVRCAVTVANTLADQLKIPIAGVHLSDVYAARASHIYTRNPKSEVRSPILWLHSTKSTSLFVRGFGSFQTLWPEPVLITLEELLQRCPRSAPFCGELLPKHQEALAHTIAPLQLQSLEDALPELLKGLLYTEEAIAPWYGRGW
jgi:tRNA threonylcarbamoyl adenosine modification protein YeaZ